MHSGAQAPHPDADSSDDRARVPSASTDGGAADGVTGDDTVKDDMIALGLGIRRPAADGAPAVQNDLMRMPIEKLLTLLRDFVSAVELADEGTLRDTIENTRKTVVAAADSATILSSIDACNDACRQVLGLLERQRLEHKEEIATLVDMVREALAIVAGDGKSFNASLGTSMQRFEALVHIDDVRQLKVRLLKEVGELRQIAEERQKAWDQTCAAFTERVNTLETQLHATKQEASLDPLTRIGNRGAFDRACREWIAADRGHFVMALIDFDHFKAINDTNGHQVGDRALVAVAQALKNSVRSKSDLVARIGGDEFGVLVADLNLRQTESRMRMLNSSLSLVSFETNGAPLRITLSIGITEYSAGDTQESLMGRADSALYEAKRLGRNRVVIKAKPTMRDLLHH
jgi:diguanylate cyclase (GGDEF)-like protein